MSGIKVVVCFAFVGLMTIPLTKAICPGPSKTFKGPFSIDGCNLCKCKNGHASCTEMFCGNKCRFDYYMDPCNFCKCIDGMGACTRMYCDLSWSSKQTKETKENKLGMYNGRVRINGKNPDFPYEEVPMARSPNVYWKHAGNLPQLCCKCAEKMRQICCMQRRWKYAATTP